MLSIFSVEALVAMYLVCRDYHSGQWSRGYEIMCIIGERFKRRSIPRADTLLFNRCAGDENLTPEVQKLYFKLAEKYHNEL